MPASHAGPGPEQILIIAPSWIGDMVMAQPLLARLHEQGDVHIDVLALPWIKPLLARMPGVDGIVDMPLGHGRLALFQRYRIGRSLRGRYHRAIVLPNTLKSAFIPWAAHIPVRTGYKGEPRYGLLNDRRKLDKSAMPKLFTRYLALAEHDHSEPAERYPQLQVSEQQLEQTCADLNICRPQQKILGLCPGAEYGEAKRWPECHYAKVAQHALDQGHAVWLFGSAKDRAVTQAINAACDDGCVDLAGMTSLDQAIDLMSLTDAVVTNDSGLMHVACALGRKVVAVFGSTSPDYTPPLSDQAQVLRLGLDCSPCFQRSCPLGHLDCLNKLLPEQVIEALG